MHDSARHCSANLYYKKLASCSVCIGAVALASIYVCFRFDDLRESWYLRRLQTLEAPAEFRQRFMLLSEIREFAGPRTFDVLLERALRNSMRAGDLDVCFLSDQLSDERAQERVAEYLASGSVDKRKIATEILCGAGPIDYGIKLRRALVETWASDEDDVLELVIRRQGHGVLEAGSPAEPSFARLRRLVQESDIQPFFLENPLTSIFDGSLE